MECSLGKTDWMCEQSCVDCEHAVFHEHDRQFNGGLSIKPADGVQVYEDGRPAKVVPVRIRVTRVLPVVEGKVQPVKT